jgi:hypothetical protein
MRYRQEVDEEGLSGENRVHAGLKLREHGLQHLIHLRRMEEALGRLGDIQKGRSEVEGVASELVRVGEELVVQGIVERPPRDAEVPDGEHAVAEKRDELIAAVIDEGSA